MKYTRKCEDCGKIEENEIKLVKNANRWLKHPRCRSCGAKIASKLPSRIESFLKVLKSPARFKNKKGRSFSEEEKAKISEQVKKRFLDPEERKKQSERTKKYFETHSGTMTGKRVYDIWLEKYGKEEADRLEQIKRNKNSEYCGEKHFAFGKSPSIKCGRGISGIYKEFNFRSLLEISYILYLIDSNIEFESAEILGSSIKYKDDKNRLKSYRPDFILNKKILIEIKPKALHDHPIVLLKQKSALEYCKINGLEYQIIDFKINYVEINEEYLKGNIKFYGNCEERFKRIFQKTMRIDQRNSGTG